ncbi:hypothetical protein RIF29_13544 [Crotalaria pallida]|uniref:Uncharacterized protein n=1 Tax=Crotalaria pallida TaxID=3830 RepID=A0AAN9IPP2_CROPI
MYFFFSNLKLESKYYILISNVNLFVYIVLESLSSTHAASHLTRTKSTNHKIRTQVHNHKTPSAKGKAPRKNISLAVQYE